MTKNHLNENYEPNKLIRLAWKWFCEIHESSLSPLAFKVGYRLYKYIMHLCSEQTTIIVCFASRKCSVLQPKLPKHLPAVCNYRGILSIACLKRKLSP
ncbi:hypothetical protein, partial [Brevibacillus borstelensis]|uniref:hypothetical protein n=1 Tax=Brevibacillus borstelensis TaxID=45462 RepID=UPI001C0F5A42